ncbi:G10 protein [Mycena kentingensis (nom. inval.)]|nr:G10 protein [Mycena kentingensis (nom. inval.)]
MPKIKTTRTKKPPEGFEEIRPILEEYDKKMRDAENESHEGKRKNEATWPIMQISHARSRYIYERRYKHDDEEDAMSKELYEWLLKEGYADAKCVFVQRSRTLLTCLSAAASLQSGRNSDTKNFAACVAFRPRCGIPIRPGTIVQCNHCGCRGCSSDS